jgi:uncharacterized repeat protein (TIGR01451 family)
MKALKWTTAIAVLGLSSPLFASAANNIIVSHYETLQRMSLQSTSGASEKLRSSGPVDLSFDALGKTFDLQLEPNDGLFSASVRSGFPDGIEVYRGQLAGAPGSWTRIVVVNGMPRGLVWDGEQLFAIEAPGDTSLPSASSVIYRLADTFVAPGSMTCGSESLSSNGADIFSKLSGELRNTISRGPGAVLNMDIGVVGDFEFTDYQGGDAQARAAIITRLNNVDGIFSQQLQLQLTVAAIETNVDINDPFGDTTVPSDLLAEVATYRQSTPTQSSQGLTHLYTGRVLDGSTVGIAYSGVPTGGVLCNTNFGAGLSEGHDNPTFDSLVAAHEIGHNFGAPHDGQSGSLCEAEPPSFIMAQTLNGSDQFSACSITQMQIEIAQAACIAPLPSVDMTVALNGPPPSALLGNSATLTFDVTNNGTLLATNVTADITVPNNVSFVSVAASAGSCTEGGGIVNCVFGDVPGATGRSVIISTIATQVGSGNFNALVNADIDDDTSNNQQTVQLDVIPAVNLLINTPNAATIELDQSTTVRATLENQSDLDATSVTLSISLSSGLQASSADWSIGTCTVTPQLINCQADSFAAQSTSTLSVGVTGATAGNKSYTAILASSEPDTNLANNSVTGSVRVNSPGAADEGGGGGSFSLAFLVFLSSAMFWTRRRPTVRRSVAGHRSQ